MFSYSILFLFILLFSPSSSPLESWCLLGSGAISTVRALGVTENVSTNAITFQPPEAWNGQQTHTPGASVTYLCTQACTGIIIIGSQPDHQTSQFSVCLDCINPLPGSLPNLTAVTVSQQTFQFAVEDLSPAVHTLQVITHSTAPFNVDGVQVILPFPSSNNPGSTATNAATSSTSTSTSTTSTSTSSTSTSTSTLTASASTSTSSPSNSTSSASATTSSSSHSAPAAIAVSVTLLVLALLPGIALYFYRRRKRQQNGGGSNGGDKGLGKRLSRMISWPRPPAEDPIGPVSPMLETFRTSRNLDLEAGYGASGLYNADITVPKGTGPPAYLSTSDPNYTSGATLSTGAILEGGQQTNKTLDVDPGAISTRSASRLSAYSSYTDPWEEIDFDYFNSDDDGNDSDSSGQGHTYLKSKKSFSSHTSSKRERLKVNLQIPTKRPSTRSKRSTRTRDTTASSFQTPAAVKNMLSELNNAIRGNADRFAWKRSMPPVPAVPSLYTQNMPMRSLSPPATEGRGHRPTRSTDVLI